MNDLWARVIELERRKRKAASQIDLMGQQLAELQSRRNQQALGPYYPGTGSPEIVIEYVKRIEVRLKFIYINQYQWTEPTTANFLKDFPGDSISKYAQDFLFSWQYADTVVDTSKTFRLFVRDINLYAFDNNEDQFYNLEIAVAMFYNLQDKKTYINLYVYDRPNFVNGDDGFVNGYEMRRSDGGYGGILKVPQPLYLPYSSHPIKNTSGEIDIPAQFYLVNRNRTDPIPPTKFDGIVSIRWGSLGTIPDTGGTPMGSGDKLLTQSSGDWGSLGTGELTDGGTF